MAETTGNCAGCGASAFTLGTCSYCGRKEPRSERMTVARVVAQAKEWCAYETTFPIDAMVRDMERRSGYEPIGALLGGIAAGLSANQRYQQDRNAMQQQCSDARREHEARMSTNRDPYGNPFR